MKLLFLCPAIISGAGKIICALYDHCLAAGHEVRVMVYKPMVGAIHQGRIRPEHLHYVDMFHRSDAGMQAAIDYVAAFCEQYRPDVVHSFSGVPAHVANEAVGDRAVRIGTLFSWGLYRPRAMDLWDASAFAGQDVVTVCSDEYYGRLLGLGVPGDKLCKIPLGIDMPVVDDQYSWVHGLLRYNLEVVPCYVAAIEPRKRIHLAIQAAYDAGLAPLRVLGQVRDGAYYKQLTSMNSPWRHIKTTDDMQGFLDECNVFIAPSENEGFGLAVLEAMARGLLVVASDIPGHREFCNSGNSVLVFNGYSADYAKAIHDIIRQPYKAQKLIHGGIATATAHNMSSVIGRYMLLYNRLADARRQKVVDK